jgi:ACT domain-containing protein
MKGKDDLRERIGIGYIAEACKRVGVSRSLFDKARRNRNEGKRMSRKQIELLAMYHGLEEEAKRKLKTI